MSQLYEIVIPINLDKNRVEKAYEADEVERIFLGDNKCDDEKN